MSDTKMPAAEAGADERELASYELAFHVLPTVAEGEVTAIFQQLKDIITKKNGEIFGEEAPARFDLAYEIIKYLEGRNRKFTSAYFGWVRFKVEPEAIESISEKVEAINELLRHLLIKLTKSEEENPFMFHEALVDRKVKNIDLDEVADEEETEAEVEESDDSDTEDEATEDGEEEADKV